MTKAKMMLVVSALALAACGPGEQGPAGPPGPAGPGNNSVTTTVCQGTLNIAGGGLPVVHLLYKYEDGSVLTTCVVSSANVQGSGTFLYRKKDPGSADGLCAVTLDVSSPANAGFFTFRAASSGSTSNVTYTDSGSSDSGKVYPLPCQTS